MTLPSVWLPRRLLCWLFFDLVRLALPFVPLRTSSMLLSVAQQVLAFLSRRVVSVC